MLKATIIYNTKHQIISKKTVQLGIIRKCKNMVG